MVVRDAHPTDVEAIAELTGVSRDAASRLLQERTVRVHVPDGDGDGDGDDGGDDELAGFISFDATERAVQLTHLAGPPEAYPDLLAEAIRFAANAELPIETVVPDGEAATRDALTAAGFDACGDGPRFDGTPTTRYRRPVEADDEGHGSGSNGDDADRET